MTCRAVVKNSLWFTEPHRCPYGAGPDGYCARHTPAKLIAMLRAKETRLEAKLAKVRAQLLEISDMVGSNNRPAA